MLAYTGPEIFQIINAGLRSRLAGEEAKAFAATWGPVIARLVRALTKNTGLRTVQEEGLVVHRGFEWYDLPPRIFEQEHEYLISTGYTAFRRRKSKGTGREQASRELRVLLPELFSSNSLAPTPPTP